MNEKFPSRKKALEILKKSGCSGNVIEHCKIVSKLATEIAHILKDKGYSVDAELVEIGALLHDVGRSQTHTVDHAIEGVKIAQSLGLSGLIVSIIKKHVGGGITSDEARDLGWPDDVYIPETLEEKIVSYADKLIDNLKEVPIERAVSQLDRELPHSAIKRIWKIHYEILSLISDS